jgi:hypothetical protein
MGAMLLCALAFGMLSVYLYFDRFARGKWKKHKELPDFRSFHGKKPLPGKISVQIAQRWLSHKIGQLKAARNAVLPKKKKEKI